MRKKEKRRGKKRRGGKGRETEILSQSERNCIGSRCMRQSLSLPLTQMKRTGREKSSIMCKDSTYQKRKSVNNEKFSPKEAPLIPLLNGKSLTWGIAKDVIY